MQQFDFHDARLLLLGRDFDMLLLLREVLSNASFHVQTSSLDRIQEQFTQTRPSIIIYDESTSAPDAEQLYALLQERSPWRRVPFVLLSDMYTGTRAARCLDRGMNEFIPKPFDVDELAARIRKILREAKPIGLDDEPSLVEQVLGFSGDLAYLGLPDLLMNLHQNMRTGDLAVHMELGEYNFHFHRGKLTEIHGPHGMQGLKAMFRAIRDLYGRFVFTPLDAPGHAPRTPYADLPNLILLAVQESDEYNLLREKLPASPTLVTYTPGGLAEVTQDGVLHPLFTNPTRHATIDELILASEETDLEALRALIELDEADQLIFAET